MMKITFDFETILKERQVSKNKLCVACKLQRTQLNNYCNNKVTRIDLAVLARICTFLECTPNDLLRLEMEEES